MSHFMLIDSTTQMRGTNLFKDKNSQIRYQKNNKYLHSFVCVKEIGLVIPQRKLGASLINFTNQLRKK